MGSPKENDPASVLDVLTRWDIEAEHIILSEIGAWRPCLQWRDPDRDPWPPPPSTLFEETALVCDWVRDTTGLETKCFEVVAGAAQVWLANRCHAGLPEQQELHLELLIAQAVLHLSMFPLRAEVGAATPEADPQAIQSALVIYALRVRDACWELIRDWPPSSEARWRYYNVVIPKYTKDVLRTPLSLALSEARRNGELSVMAPMLQAVDAGLSDYVYRFTERSQGNAMIPEPSALNLSINDILPFLGSACEQPEDQNGREVLQLPDSEARRPLANQGCEPVQRQVPGVPSSEHADAPLGAEPSTGQDSRGQHSIPRDTELTKSPAKHDLWNALTDRQRNSMRALLEMRAFDAESRRSANEIAPRAEGRGANVSGFKVPLSDLVNRGLGECKRGCKGGYWLTGDGRGLLAAFDIDSATDDPTP